MGSRLPAVLFGIAALLAPMAAIPGQTGRAEQEPRYDPGSVVNVSATVTDTREVPKGSPLSGLHLVVVDTDKETTVEVYVAPVQYLKELQITYARGNRLQIAGSKVKFGGGTIVLAREVRRDLDTAYFRDEKGRPYWTGGPT
ncbi:MAG: hypothetical protein LAQ69_34235 [Acidobacteriia bacterium]|nr:hypothetical protein [Terriglobia bacterium]